MNIDRNNKNKQPKVTIGLPVYNGYSHIQTAIRCILNQTYQDFELIIADNCSTDSTFKTLVEIAKQEKRITLYQHTVNIGAENNFSFVKDYAKGEYFMWAAHDDTWSPTHLEQAVKILDNNPSIGFVFPQFSLKSIKFLIKKKIDRRIFSFIESTDSDHRIRSFCNLHHSSHKCNMVYSLFRLEILDTACRTHNIKNDGLLSVIILSISRGQVSEKCTFQKRYNSYWPGFMFTTIYKIKNMLGLNVNQEEFNKIKLQSSNELISLFPEIECDLQLITDNYLLDRCLRDYRIYPFKDKRVSHE